MVLKAQQFLNQLTDADGGDHSSAKPDIIRGDVVRINETAANTAPTACASVQDPHTFQHHLHHGATQGKSSRLTCKDDILQPLLASDSG